MRLSTFLISLCVLTLLKLSWGVPTRKSKYFDIQGIVAVEGRFVESLLPSFAWGLIDGVATLEMDNGITKDGAVIVWHDEVISGSKCNDTKPAFKGDRDFPYVGKAVAHLTLAQIKTLDCGSKRLLDHPLALTYPGTKISTLSEVFKFTQCVDIKREIEFNIESKINPEDHSATRGVDDFVQLQLAEFRKSDYKLSQIYYQSFDWRTLIKMKATEPKVPLAALIDHTTVYGADNATSVWLGGVRVQDFPGETTGHKVALAAQSIKADIISPAAFQHGEIAGIDPSLTTYVPFATKGMIEKAHELGMLVKPWTVNHLNIAAQLLDWGVDGIITDYPEQVRRLVQQRKFAVSPKFPKRRVFECLNKHIQKV